MNTEIKKQEESCCFFLSKLLTSPSSSLSWLTGERWACSDKMQFNIYVVLENENTGADDCLNNEGQGRCAKFRMYYFKKMYAPTLTFFVNYKH